MNLYFSSDCLAREDVLKVKTKTRSQEMTDCISHQNGHAVQLAVNLIFLRRKMGH